MSDDWDWAAIDTESGTWSVNWTHVRKIVNWYHQSALLLAHSQRRAVEDDVGPVERLFRDPVYTLDVDWNAVRNKAEHNTRAEMNAIMDPSPGYDDGFMGYLASDLFEKIRQSLQYRERFLIEQKHVQHSSMRAIAGNTARLETSVDIARVIRDLSADFVVYGFGVMSGGLSIGLRTVVAGESAGVIKALTKFQDTGDIGAATLTLTGEVVAAIVPLKVGGKVKTLVVAGAKGLAEGGAALVAGDDLADAAGKAAAKAGEDVAKQVFESTFFKRWAEAKAVWVGGKLEGGIAPATGKIASKASAKGTVKLSKTLLTSHGGGAHAAPKGMAERSAYVATLDRQQALLRLALVPPAGYSLLEWASLVGRATR